MRSVLPGCSVGSINQGIVGGHWQIELLTGHVSIVGIKTACRGEVVPCNRGIGRIGLGRIVGEGSIVVEHAAVKLIDESGSNGPVEPERSRVVLGLVARNLIGKGGFRKIRGLYGRLR